MIKNIVLLALIIFSFILHLLANNFGCLFWPIPGIEELFCYYTGIGMPKSKVYYWSEIFFQLSTCIYLCKNIQNKTIGNIILYTLYELFFFTTTDSDITYIGGTSILSYVLIINISSYLFYIYSAWSEMSHSRHDSTK